MAEMFSVGRNFPRTVCPVGASRGTMALPPNLDKIARWRFDE
jgi:hypothetical protein